VSRRRRDRDRTATRVVDRWIETGQWWHDPYGEPREIPSFRIEARSAHGYTSCCSPVAAISGCS
jgi:hypothetical protein